MARERISIPGIQDGKPEVAPEMVFKRSRTSSGVVCCACAGEESGRRAKSPSSTPRSTCNRAGKSEKSRPRLAFLISSHVPLLSAKERASEKSRGMLPRSPCMLMPEAATSSFSFFSRKACPLPVCNRPRAAITLASTSKSREQSTRAARRQILPQERVG